DLKVHWSLFLLVAYVFVQSGGAPLAPAGIGGGFGRLLLHGLGPAPPAPAFGLGGRRIPPCPFAGGARPGWANGKPWQEFWIAVAGPAVNVAIILLLLVTLPVAQRWPGLMTSPEFTGLVSYLLLANGMLVGFNLLPVFPMDGGRVFRAFLTPFVGHLKATETPAKVGAFMALLL